MPSLSSRNRKLLKRFGHEHMGAGCNPLNAAMMFSQTVVGGIRFVSTLTCHCKQPLLALH